MNNFFNIFKKELKELLTKQMLLSLVFMVMFFALMGSLINNAKEQTQDELLEPTRLAVLNLDNSAYSKEVLNKLTENKIEIVEVKEENIEKAIKESQQKESTLLLVIPKGFEENIKNFQGTEIEIYSIVKDLGLKESASFASISSIISYLNQEINKDFIKSAFGEEKPENIINPIKTKEFVVIKDKIAPGNPATLQSLSMANSTIIPILLMISIMYAGTMIITSMGLEKENKTLETLLTLPVKRISIILGKMAGAIVVALLMAVVYIGGFNYYMSSFTPTPPIEGGENIMQALGLEMSSFDYLLLGISLFLTILVALSICMILGMFAQNIKSAQSMQFPIILLIMIPYLLLTFQNLETMSMGLKIFLYLIPFSHPFIASKVLIFDNYSIVIAGIIYLIIFAALTMYLAIRLFNTDKVLTAKSSSFGKLKFRKIKK
jgi:ABC-2 type transport system permease protein